MSQPGLFTSSKLSIYRQKPESTVDKVFPDSAVLELIGKDAQFIAGRFDNYDGTVYENDVKRAEYKYKRTNNELFYQEIVNRMKKKPLPNPLPRSRVKKIVSKITTDDDFDSQQSTDSDLFSTK
jgi:hypothetical protein